MTGQHIKERQLRQQVDGRAESLAQDALNRMRRAHERKTGCHLTAGMIAALGITPLGETWEEPDPRDGARNVTGSEGGPV